MGEAQRKLSDSQREEILRRFGAGESMRSLAGAFGVCETTIRKLCRRKPTVESVVNEGREQSYRENLNWALQAAGEFLRTKRRPTTCPNDGAWFLYCQAIDEPKDFMAKLTTVEGKADQGDGDRATKAAAKRSIAELDAMLEELTAEASDGA